MFQPYDYQLQCNRKIQAARQKGNKQALIVMASGLGKTVTMGLDVRKWVKHDPSARVLFLCHQEYILRHARATFETMIGGQSELYGYYHGRSKAKGAQFLFASFQTMHGEKRKFKRDEFDYIVVDESHHSHATTYSPTLQHFKPKFLLGATATPDRSDLQDIRSIFGDEVFSLNLPEALARGYLTPVDYRLVTDELMELGKIENPYKLSVTELNKRIFVPKRDQEIVRIIREKSADIHDPKIMTFCNSIAHAERFHSHYQGSLPIHSKLGAKEQEARMDMFEQGLVENAVTVDKFNEGIDVPGINVVVFLRTTESPRIFYQQLGRGLRRVEGKKKVLVLDFVANCERIRQINFLAQEIEGERQKIQQSQGGREALSGAVTIDFGRFNFTETAKDILAILEKVEGGYTEEVLIAQLQAEAKLLQRTPLGADIAIAARKGRTAGFKVFVDHFVTWNKALRAAKLPLNSHTQTEGEDLIDYLKGLARRLKKTPTQTDVDEASKRGEGPACKPFIRVFGNWNNTLSSAGLKLNSLRSLSDQELIELLKLEARRLKRVPTQVDLTEASKKGRAPNSAMLRRRFGSCERAYKIAKLKIVYKTYKREELISQFQAEAARIGKIPSIADIDLASKEGRTASGPTFASHFGGSWQKVCHAAGFKK